MTYDFKALEELRWALAVAAVVYAADLAIRFDPDTVTDWRAYLLSGVGGLVRVLAGALLAKMRPAT